MSALLFTAFVTPFHVAFIEFHPSILDAPIDFTSNRIVDTIFIVDIGVTFFLPYRAPAREGGAMIYVRGAPHPAVLCPPVPSDAPSCAHLVSSRSLV
jgi:hypothetical protein